MHRRVWIGALVAVALAWICPAAAAATLEPIGSFDRPISVSSDPGNAERLLVAERPGIVVEVAAGGVRVLADLRSLVSCCDGERGLLSIAPAPDFGSSGRFYAAYAGTAAASGQEGDLHIDSFRPEPQASGGLLREPVIAIDHSQFENHYGGQLQFGPDGNVYISVGDGGGAGNPLQSGQDPESLLGKILRIDPRPGQVPPYAIPAGNPLAATAGRDEIWAYGLRNPWRFSFDRVGGAMVIGDVGQGAREEIDYAPSPSPGVVGGAGANYGWNCREGTIAYSGAPAGCTSAGGFTEPVFDYPHEDPGGGAAHGCSIIGGYVVRDASLGDLYGRYVYADYCTGEIRSLALPVGGGAATGDRAEGLELARSTGFGEDACGRLYVSTEQGGVFRLAGTSRFAGTSPAICPQADAIPTRAIKRQRRAHLLLSVAPLRSGSSRFQITARLTPCAESASRRVRLKRGGRRVATRRLDRHCIARFRLRLRHRSTFRAVLSRNAMNAPVRSSRLVVKPAAT